MGATVSFNEQKPNPDGHYLARSMLSWLVTFYFIWLLGQAIVDMLIFIEVITTHPYLFPILLMVSIFVGTVIALFNVFYWSPKGKTRKTDFSKCAKPATRELIFDRLCRAAIDQWLLFSVIGIFIFIFISLIVFYAHTTGGVETYAPLSFAPNGVELRNWFLMKGMVAGVLLTTAFAFTITMYTVTDTLKKVFFHPYYRNLVSLPMLDDSRAKEDNAFGDEDL